MEELYLMTVLWSLYWLCLITAATGSIYIIVDRFSHRELDGYNREISEKVRAAELERLRRLPTKSRIGRKPDL